MKKLIIIILILLSSHGMVAYADSPSDSSFLAITDFHFDPFIACENVKTKTCPMIQQLRKADASQWQTILAREDTVEVQFKQDTNDPLFVSSLQQAKEVADKTHVKFVLVLGDFLGHEYRQYYKRYSQDKSFAGYQSFVKKTLAFMTLQLSQAFPNIDVYSMVGNNDSYLGDYVTAMHSDFFRDTAQLWGSLIKNKAARAAMQKQYADAGYYALDVPAQPGLRLIVLNSVLFSYKAKGKGVVKAASDELAWLQQQLQMAVQRKQKVFIATHIPPSYDIYATGSIKLFTLFNLWHQADILKFRDELNQYADIISGIFVGHLHSDWQQDYKSTNGDSITIFGTPSISPIFGNNPAFKVYFYDPVSLEETNAITYTYTLRATDEWMNDYTMNDATHWKGDKIKMTALSSN